MCITGAVSSMLAAAVVILLLFFVLFLPGGVDCGKGGGELRHGHPRRGWARQEGRDGPSHRVPHTPLGKRNQGRREFVFCVALSRFFMQLDGVRNKLRVQSQCHFLLEQLLRYMGVLCVSCTVELQVLFFFGRQRFCVFAFFFLVYALRPVRGCSSRCRLRPHAAFFFFIVFFFFYFIFFALKKNKLF